MWICVFECRHAHFWTIRSHIYNTTENCVASKRVQNTANVAAHFFSFPFFFLRLSILSFIGSHWVFGAYTRSLLTQLVASWFSTSLFFARAKLIFSVCIYSPFTVTMPSSSMPSMRICDACLYVCYKHIYSVCRWARPDRWWGLICCMYIEYRKHLPKIAKKPIHTSSDLQQ